MKIKDYKCKCGNNDFFLADKDYQIGIYCSYCGKWFKWANKYERNLDMKQDSKTGLDRTIGRILAILVDNGVIERDQAVWILEPLKEPGESENKNDI